MTEHEERRLNIMIPGPYALNFRYLFTRMRRACANVRPLMKLLIRNLARSTTEPELLALFAAFGHVQACDLVLDKSSGLSKGFGFVEIPKAGEAKTAMKAINGKLVDGNKLRVKKAEPTPKK